MRYYEIINEREMPYSLIDKLDKYCLDPKIYISFTQLPKLGINPLSDYNTPIGICAYPLSLTWNKRKSEEARKEYQDDNDINLKRYFPFAADNPYCQVFRIAKSARVLDTVKYTEADFDEDMNKLWNILEAEDITEEEFEILKTGVTPPLSDYRYWIDDISQKAKNNTPIWRLWYALMWISEYFSFNRKKRKNARSNLSSIFWNNLLRKLGYDVVKDDGLGVIHSYEPIQGLFLSIKSLEFIETLDNKIKHDRSYKKLSTNDLLIMNQCIDEMFDQIIIDMRKKVTFSPSERCKTKEDFIVDFLNKPSLQDLIDTIMMYLDDGIGRRSDRMFIYNNETTIRAMIKKRILIAYNKFKSS